MKRSEFWGWAVCFGGIGFLAGVMFASCVALAGEPRHRAPITAFRQTHPCPTTGKTSGPCPGWVVDHKYPLCAGGADAPANMQWQELEPSYVKDRLEREVCALRSKLAAQGAKCP